MIESVTPETFESMVQQSKKLVLVDFWAPWCAPCKVILPQVERISAESVDWLTVLKCNAEDYTDFAKEYNVTSLPCFVLFSGGTEVARKVGATGGYKALQSLVSPYKPSL